MSGPATDTPVLDLLYKPFRAVYEPALPPKEEWGPATEAIFRIVYGGPLAVSSWRG